MNGYDVQEVYSQQEALDLTVDTRIEKILTDTQYDIAWELADGRIVAYEKGTGGGCDTCGYGGDEDHWYVLTPVGV
jgi:hypothetical protein